SRWARANTSLSGVASALSIALSVIGRPAPIGAVTPGNRTTSLRGRTGRVSRSVTERLLSMAIGATRKVAHVLVTPRGIPRATPRDRYPAALADGSDSRAALFRSGASIPAREAGAARHVARGGKQVQIRRLNPLPLAQDRG